MLLYGRLSTKWLYIKKIDRSIDVANQRGIEASDAKIIFSSLPAVLRRKWQRDLRLLHLGLQISQLVTLVPLVILLIDIEIFNIIGRVMIACTKITV